jgi:glycerophosphoryl diester phosphodiesterase
MQSDLHHKMPLIIGHRGASREAPENTLESFRLAWQQGADGIEADFRLTADGRIVTMHDDTTARTTSEDLAIAKSTLKELRRLDAGSWKGKKWSGAMIPTLDEVLAARPGNSWLFIEIKSGPEILDPLKTLLERSGASPERIRLLSFSAPLISEIKQRLPEWLCCWLCDYRHNISTDTWSPSRESVFETLKQLDADGLASANRLILNRDFVNKLGEHRKELHIWTVDKANDARRLRGLDVNSIMTNRPGWLRQQLAEKALP